MEETGGTLQPMTYGWMNFNAPVYKRISLKLWLGFIAIMLQGFLLYENNLPSDAAMAYSRSVLRLSQGYSSPCHGDG